MEISYFCISRANRFGSSKTWALPYEGFTKILQIGSVDQNGYIKNQCSRSVRFSKDPDPDHIYLPPTVNKNQEQLFKQHITDKSYHKSK
jgi:hypothetical protein